VVDSPRKFPMAWGRVELIPTFVGGYAGAPSLGRWICKLHTFAVAPQRCVVDRSFAWLEKMEKTMENRERLLNTSLQMIHLALLVLLLRRS
jgi:hypothetical protein